jgi:hypothetical protein
MEGIGGGFDAPHQSCISEIRTDCVLWQSPNIFSLHSAHRNQVADRDVTSYSVRILVKISLFL